MTLFTYCLIIRKLIYSDNLFYDNWIFLHKKYLTMMTNNSCHKLEVLGLFCDNGKCMSSQNDYFRWQYFNIEGKVITKAIVFLVTSSSFISMNVSL